MFFLLLFVFSALFQLFLPWWVSGLLCFAMAVGWDKSRHGAFLQAGGSQALLWTGYALIKDFNNEHLLSVRMAELFSLPYGWMMPWLSGILVFVTAGLAGYAGARVRDTFLMPSTPPSTHDTNP